MKTKADHMEHIRRKYLEPTVTPMLLLFQSKVHD